MASSDRLLLIDVLLSCVTDLPIDGLTLEDALPETIVMALAAVLDLGPVSVAGIPVDEDLVTALRYRRKVEAARCAREAAQ